MTDTTRTLRALSRDVIEALSAHFQEPDWFYQRRQEAWRLFLDTPWPDSSRDEEWRKTDVRPIIEVLSNATPVTATPASVTTTEALPDKLQGILRAAEKRAGLLVRREGGLVFYDVNPDVTAQGVIFADLETALREHGDLLKEHLGAVVQADEGKFQALHAAMMSGGVVIYVPDNVTVERPFQIVHWLDNGGVMSFPHVLVITGRNASVTVLDEYLSYDFDTPSYVGGVIELVVGENSTLTYLDVQNWGEGVYHLSTQRARLFSNATLNWSTGEFGSTLTRFETEVLLDGDGATAFLQGVYFPQKKQHIANHTLQHHRSTHTSSDLLYKGALIGEAHTVYRGLIRVDRGAQQTDAYQANRNLILSPKAHADSIPMLEIEANDVRCTHGATISQIDEEELFYLMSRGIPRDLATRVIVDGFFAPVLERIPLRQVRDRLRNVIHERLGY